MNIYRTGFKKNFRFYITFFWGKINKFIFFLDFLKPKGIFCVII